jgi:hypothetical protein
MKTLGRKEIKEAIKNINFDKMEYQGYEIDNLILDYYKLDKDVLFEEYTENSNEFIDIGYVYELIDDLMREKGYVSDDLCLYKKEAKDE